MAIKKCKECGSKVSTKADACPSCGATQKRKTLGCGAFILILVILTTFGSIVSNFTKDTKTTSFKSSVSKPAIPKTAEEIHQDKIERSFSGWDGSHRGLTKLIKKTMNDPDSYDHDETVYWDKGDHLLVKTTFRGKNAFGGTVKNWVMAKADLDGNVIEVVSQGP